MFKFFFISFLFFLLMVFLFGFSLIRLFFKALFGTNPRSQSQPRSTQKERVKREAQNDFSPRKSKKIFTPEDGEYVEYEDVSDPR